MCKNRYARLTFGKVLLPLHVKLVKTSRVSHLELLQKTPCQNFWDFFLSYMQDTHVGESGREREEEKEIERKRKREEREVEGAEREREGVVRVRGEYPIFTLCHE